MKGFNLKNRDPTTEMEVCLYKIWYSIGWTSGAPGTLTCGQKEKCFMLFPLKLRTRWERMGQIFQVKFLSIKGGATNLVQQILGSHQGSSRTGSSTCFLRTKKTHRDATVKAFQLMRRCPKKAGPPILQSTTSWGLTQPWWLGDPPLEPPHLASIDAQVAVGGWHWAVTVGGPIPDIYIYIVCGKLTLASGFVMEKRGRIFWLFTRRIPGSSRWSMRDQSTSDERIEVWEDSI